VNLYKEAEHSPQAGNQQGLTLPPHNGIIYTA
jgi:hypothetical protein